MSELLKISRNGQILYVALDRPEANALDAPRFDPRAGGRMMAPGGYSPDELLLTLAPYRDTPPQSIEGMYFYTINQIESTDK